MATSWFIEKRHEIRMKAKCDEIRTKADCDAHKNMVIANTGYINPILGYCWTSVCDVEPALTQHWVNVSCLLDAYQAKPNKHKTFVQRFYNVCITFVQRRPNVFDVGPTLYKCYTNVLCLLGRHCLTVCLFVCWTASTKRWSNAVLMFNVGPASPAMGQHETQIESMSQFIHKNMKNSPICFNPDKPRLVLKMSLYW